MQYTVEEYLHNTDSSFITYTFVVKFGSSDVLERCNTRCVQRHPSHVARSVRTCRSRGRKGGGVDGQRTHSFGPNYTIAASSQLAKRTANITKCNNLLLTDQLTTPS